MKAMYRLPKDPGYVGGYYLTPTVTGLICLLLSNILATEYVAHHFEYQDALGEPLWHVGPVGIYQPFAWVSWVWHYGSSVDPAIRNPVLLAAFIVIAGAFATGVFFFLLNLQHTRRLSKNTEDLHGSARWATKEDVEATGLLDAKQGVYVGGWYDESTRHLHYQSEAKIWRECQKAPLTLSFDKSRGILVPVSGSSRALRFSSLRVPSCNPSTLIGNSSLIG